MHYLFYPSETCHFLFSRSILLTLPLRLLVVSCWIFTWSNSSTFWFTFWFNDMIFIYFPNVFFMCFYTVLLPPFRLWLPRSYLPSSPPSSPPPSFPTFTTAMAGKFTSLVGNYGVNSTLSQNYVRFSKNFSPGDIARYIAR